MLSRHTSKGFAILYAVIIVSVLLALIIGITTVTVKDAQLARFDKNSTYAFYSAESAMECALYWDLKPTNTAFDPAGGTIECNGNTYTISEESPGSGTYHLGFSFPLLGGADIVVTKQPLNTSIASYGYYGDGGTGSYGVERGLFVEYGDTGGAPGSCGYDVSLVMDGSSSIETVDGTDGVLDGVLEIDQLKSAAKAIVDANQVGVNRFKFALVTFNFDGVSKLLFSDPESRNKNQIKNKIDAALTTTAEHTNIAAGLLVAKHQFLSAANRAGFPDVAILITDGETNKCVDPGSYDTTNNKAPGMWCIPDTPEVAKDNSKVIAQELKNMGVPIIVVGVGINSDYADYLKNEIASSPSNYYPVADYASLQALTSTFNCAFFSRTVSGFKRYEI